MIEVPTKRDFSPDAKRRVALCGSMRVGREQWEQFLAVLGALPYPIEIVAVAYTDMFHDVPLPENVRITKHGFLPSEKDIIDLFDREGVHACYLGLSTRLADVLFARTSLSAKLTTYLAAGIPVIADVPERSVAWRLLNESQSGALIDGDQSACGELIRALFKDAESWKEMSCGALALCQREMDLTENAVGLRRLLALRD